MNNSEEDNEKFADIIKNFGNGVKKIELLKYNNLAETKNIRNLPMRLNLTKKCNVYA